MRSGRFNAHLHCCGRRGRAEGLGPAEPCALVLLVLQLCPGWFRLSLDSTRVTQPQESVRPQGQLCALLCLAVPLPAATSLAAPGALTAWGRCSAHCPQAVLSHPDTSASCSCRAAWHPQQFVHARLAQRARSIRPSPHAHVPLPSPCPSFTLGRKVSISAGELAAPHLLLSTIRRLLCTRGI